MTWSSGSQPIVSDIARSLNSYFDLSDEAKLTYEVPEIVKAKTAQKLYKIDHPEGDWKTANNELIEAYKELAQADRARYANEKSIHTRLLLDLFKVYLDKCDDIGLCYVDGRPVFSEVAPSLEEGRASQMLRRLGLRSFRTLAEESGEDYVGRLSSG